MSRDILYTLFQKSIFIPLMVTGMIIGGSMMLIGLTLDGRADAPYPLDKACYVVTDSAGGVHRLVEVPQFDIRVGAILTQEGDWLFPASVETDEVCLEGSDD